MVGKYPILVRPVLLMPAQMSWLITSQISSLLGQYPQAQNLLANATKALPFFAVAATTWEQRRNSSQPDKTQTQLSLRGLRRFRKLQATRPSCFMDTTM
jgi:hypothetical protein